MSVSSIFAFVKRSILRKGVWHWVRFVCLLVLGWFAGHELKDNPYVRDIGYWLYPFQIRLQDRAPGYPRVTAVVTIEDSDYWGPEFVGRSPLRRDLLASLLDKLREAEVNTVVLDIDMRSPDPTLPGLDFTNYQSEDAKLFDSIEAMCNAGQILVVAASIRRQDDQYIPVPSIYDAHKTGTPRNFSCLRPGYIQLPEDLRLVPGQLSLGNDQTLDSLSLAALGQIDPQAYKFVVESPNRGFLYARYLSEKDYGPQDNGQYRFTCKGVQREDAVTLRHLLAKKVVLVGGAWHAFAKGQGPVVDSYNSPMGPMPGVFLHANYIEALDGERGTFAPISDLAVEILEFTLVIALALIGALDIHAAWKWGAFALSCVISVVLTYVLLENLGIFLDFLIPILLLIGHTFVEEFLGMRHKIKHLSHRTAEGHE